MKLQTFASLSLALVVGVSAVSLADVRYSVSFGNTWPADGRRDWAARPGPYYYAPYRYHRNHRYYRPAYYAPVVITPAPVYVAPPEVQAVQAAPPVALSGNYGSDLANLNEKMSRLRGVVQHQKQTGQITSEEYKRFTGTLEGIEHDEHARAYDRGGNLAPEDFYDLSRRLEEVNEDVQIALAQ